MAKWQRFEFMLIRRVFCPCLGLLLVRRISPAHRSAARLPVSGITDIPIPPSYTELARTP